MVIDTGAATSFVSGWALREAVGAASFPELWNVLPIVSSVVNWGNRNEVRLCPGRLVFDGHAFRNGVQIGRPDPRWQWSVLGRDDFLKAWELRTLFHLDPPEFELIRRAPENMVAGPPSGRRGTSSTGGGFYRDSGGIVKSARAVARSSCPRIRANRRIAVVPL